MWIYDMPKPKEKAAKLAARNRELSLNGSKQRIGKPGGNNDQRKRVQGSVFPVTRRSIIG